MEFSTMVMAKWQFRKNIGNNDKGDCEIGNGDIGRNGNGNDENGNN